MRCNIERHEQANNNDHPQPIVVFRLHMLEQVGYRGHENHQYRDLEAQAPKIRGDCWHISAQSRCLIFVNAVNDFFQFSAVDLVFIVMLDNVRKQWFDRIVQNEIKKFIDSFGDDRLTLRQ